MILFDLIVHLSQRRQVSIFLQRVSMVCITSRLESHPIIGTYVASFPNRYNGHYYYYYYTHTHTHTHTHPSLLRIIDQLTQDEDGYTE